MSERWFARVALWPLRRGLGIRRAPVPADATQAMFATIRRRLTLWYSGVLGGALLLFSVFLYLGVSHVLLDLLDTRLAERAQILSRQWQALPQFSCPRDPRSLGQSFYIACFDESGTLIWASPDATDSTGFLSAPVAVAAIRAGSEIDTVDVGPDNGAVRRYAVAVPSPSGVGLLGVIEVGNPVQAQLTSLHVLLLVLVGLGGLTILGATVGGLFLSHRALAPARLAVARQQAFIADASHELRTPLTLLRADAEVLLRGRHHMSPDDAALLEDIVAETEHMTALASNMLTLARLDASRIQPPPDVVELSAIAAAIVRRADVLACKHGVTLEATSQGRVLTLGDQVLLYEAALVLIDNAIKYNHSGGRVTVSADVVDGHARLAVTDTGIGIPPEDLPHLGERFYRVDKARSREAGGVGLGLSIARGIAAAHGGTLTVVSKPGQGTTATLMLPAIPMDGNMAARSR